jgi:hypothetical protein
MKRSSCCTSPRASFRDRLRRSVALALLAVAAVGCRAVTRRASAGDRPAVDVAALSNDLRGFASRFHATVAAVGSDIAAKTDDLAVREASLRWRTQAIPIVRTASLEPDPRVGLVTAWALCAHQRAVAGRDPPPMGDQNARFVEAARDLEAGIVAIAQRHVPSPEFDQWKSRIEKIASEEDVIARLDTASHPLQRGAGAGANPVTTLIGLPLAPLRGFEGIGDTPEELHELGRIAEQWAEIARNFPEVLRWHLELLALSLESMPTLAALQGAANAVAELQGTFAELPGNVGREVRAVIDESGETVQAVRSTVEDARETAELVEATATRAQEAVREVAPAAEALKATVESASEFAREWRATFPPRDRPAGESAPQRPSPYTPDEFASAANELTAAIGQLRGLLGDVETASRGGTVPALEQTAQSTLESAASSASGLVDRIFVRSVVVLVILFASLALLRRAHAT